MTRPTPGDDQAATSDAPDASGNTARAQTSRVGGRTSALTIAGTLAEALTALPPDADDTALMQIIGGALIPALGDFCHLHTADAAGQLTLVAVAPRESDGVRRLLTALDTQATSMLVYEALLDEARPVLVTANDAHVATNADVLPDADDVTDNEAHQAMLVAAGLQWELAIPLSGAESDEPTPAALLVLDGALDRPAPAEPFAFAAVLTGLIGGWRAARATRVHAASLQARLEDTALAGRELAHTLNNSLTMPVGVVELLLDRNSLSADLQEMLQAAASDLQALERHIRTFQEQMRQQSGGKMRPGQTLPPP